MCNIALFVDGTLPDGPRSASETSGFADNLLQLRAGEFKVIYGECRASVGISGGRTRKAWGAMLPEFLEIMKELAELPYGCTKRHGG